MNYAASDDTATAGDDYTAVSGTLSWASGDATGESFSVPVLQDAAYDPDVYVTQTPGHPTGAAAVDT